MGMWKWSIFFSYFRCNMWNFITVDHFENIVREKKRGRGALNPPLINMIKCYKVFKFLFKLF
jgi:hypothetical protein